MMREKKIPAMGQSIENKDLLAMRTYMFTL